MNIVKRTAITLTAVAAALAVPMPAEAQGVSRVEIGVLDCAVSGGTGFIFGSTKELACTFRSTDPNRPDEPYFGVIRKWGIDIGRTEGGVISWGVLAPTTDALAPGALAGDYSGVSVEATAGAGLGANTLFGGSGETLALQPLSVTAQTGLNVAATISEMQLRSGLD